MIFTWQSPHTHKNACVHARVRTHTNTSSHTYVRFWHIIEAGIISLPAVEGVDDTELFILSSSTLSKIVLGTLTHFGLFHMDTSWWQSCQMLRFCDSLRFSRTVLERISPYCWFLWSGKVWTFILKCFSKKRIITVKNLLDCPPGAYECWGLTEGMLYHSHAWCHV